MIPDVTTTSGHIRVRGDFPDADPLRLRTATGDMELEGGASSIDVRSTSGDASIHVFRPLERLFARTSSGHLRLTGGARQITTDTASGNIWMVGLSGPVDAYSSTGKITLRWDRLEGDSTVKVHTASSRIQLFVPECSHPTGFLRTVSGTVRSDFPGHVNEQGDTVQLEGSGPVLDVETASGQIILGFGEDWEEPEPTLRPRLNRDHANRSR